MRFLFSLSFLVLMFCSGSFAMNSVIDLCGSGQSTGPDSKATHETKPRADAATGQTLAALMNNIKLDADELSVKDGAKYCGGGACIFLGLNILPTILISMGGVV